MDPYAILDISYGATAEEIQTAFREKLQVDPGSPLLLEAYAMIRDPVGRRTFRWGDIRACFDLPVSDQKVDPESIAVLAQELAFLTPWELGDQTCLKI